MVNVNDLFKRMLCSLDEGKRNINQFYLTANHTITELHRIDSYTELLKSTINKLNDMLVIHGKLKKKKLPDIGKSKEYARLISNVAIEFHILKTANTAMDENINELNKTECFYHKFSGRITDLKKDINRTIRKTEKILTA